ncbi:MAG TPA: ribonuclease P protein subunit, partial [Candidatus Thermoplasmatota archaeon]|nr:ribonuclease P protein subunit [Candidatus Thermoplasmatota archaeon]
TGNGSPRSSKKWDSPPKSLLEGGPAPASLRDLRGEFLGKPAEILDAPDPTLVGKSGTIVDESLNTLVLKTADRRTLRVAKAHTVFAIDMGNGRVTVRGDRIRFRPEDRIKKVR